jgi:hypothetical protein
MFVCSKCGCVVDTAEEFEQHLKTSHSSPLLRLARRMFQL